MARYIKTKFTGVFSQPSATKKHQGRPDQAWYIVYQLAGKRKWERIGWASEGYTAAMAHQIRNTRLHEARGQAKITIRDLTLDAAYSLLWERHTQHLASSRDERNRYEVHLGPTLGPRTLASITAADVETLKAAILAKGRAAATVRHVLSILGRIYNFAAKWDIYDGPNPVTKVARPRADNRRQRYLTREEAAALLAHLKATSDYVYCLATMSLFTGLRAGEIMKMRGEHIDLAGARARVMDTKTRKDRTVYLPGPVLDLLRGREIKPGQLLFPRPKGGTYVGVSHSFDRAVKSLGLNEGRADRRDRVVFHTLRHTFASWQVIQGQSIYLVGTLLGHSSPEMTKRYAHLAPETQRAAVEAIENYFNGHNNLT